MSPDLVRLVLGFRCSQAIYVAASLGIPDLLAEERRKSDELRARRVPIRSPSIGSSERWLRSASSMRTTGVASR